MPALPTATEMTILVVDADEDRAVLLRRLLAPLSQARVLGLPDAAALFAGVADGSVPAPGQVDAVVLALRLAGDDAVVTCRRLRDDELWRDVPVLVLAADPEGDELQRCFDAGATDFLRLPFEGAEARLRLRAALQLRDAQRQRRARETEISAARDELQRSLDIVRADLGAARRLQRSLLPAADPMLPLARAGWCFRPCDEIGGDIFGILPLPDGRIAIYMLDVAGHGVPAALLSVSLHRLLSVRLEGATLLDDEGRVREPHAVVGRLARLFEPQPGSIAYFTLLYAVLDAQGGELQWCLAGHPPLLLVEPGRPAEALADGDMPVGLLSSATYRTQRRMLAAGARLVLYTDAALETESAAANEPFGLQRLLERVEASRSLGAAAAAQSLEAGVCDWRAPARLADDLSILVVDRT